MSWCSSRNDIFICKFKEDEDFNLSNTSNRRSTFQCAPASDSDPETAENNH